MKWPWSKKTEFKSDLIDVMIVISYVDNRSTAPIPIRAVLRNSVLKWCETVTEMLNKNEFIHINFGQLPFASFVLKSNEVKSISFEEINKEAERRERLRREDEAEEDELSMVTEEQDEV